MLSSIILISQHPNGMERAWACLLLWLSAQRKWKAALLFKGLLFVVMAAVVAILCQISHNQPFQCFRQSLIFVHTLSEGPPTFLEYVPWEHRWIRSGINWEKAYCISLKPQASVAQTDCPCYLLLYNLSSELFKRHLERSGIRTYLRAIVTK